MSRQSPTRIMVVRWTALDRSEHVRTIVEFLKESGFDVVFVSAVKSCAEEKDASPEGSVLSLGLEVGCSRLSKLVAFPRLALRLRGLLRTVKPDIVYVIDSWTLPLLYISTFVKLHSNRWRFVYHTFDWLEPGLHGWWTVAAERHACRSAALVINVDRSRARLQRTLYRLAETPLELPNFRTLSYAVPRRDQSVMRALFNEYSEEMTVLVCPTVAMAPRLTLQLIEGLAVLPERYRLVTFAVASEYGKLCQRRAEALGLATRIRFLSPRSHREWLTVVANGDIGVIFHDVEESSGYWMANSDRLASFVACGIPVICMDVPNLEALVYRFSLGVCCDPRDPSAIAEAARSLTEGAPALGLRRIEIRKMFERHLNFDAVGQRLLDRLSGLCNDVRSVRRDRQ